jgi:branched-chain amino acid transport system ATP-binding protein
VLKLSGVSASYGSVPAIHDVGIEIAEGEAVGLLGANGAGKSTTLRVISGLVKASSGTINFAGLDLASLPPHKIPELGIAHVPEGRQVFPEMTVQENLEIGAYVPKAKADRRRSLDLVYGIFPRLADRKKQLAGTMSGGEQQMLAVGRGLMLKPRLLMLDEPSLGLAPVMTDVTFEKIGEIHGDSPGRAKRQPRAVAGAARLCAGKRQRDHARHQRGARRQQAGAGGVSRDLARRIANAEKPPRLDTSAEVSGPHDFSVRFKCRSSARCWRARPSPRPPHPAPRP